MTYFQTITIEMPTSSIQFFGMEEAPICPPSYKPESDNGFIVMKTEDNSIITWWKRGEIIKISNDGVIKTWYPKPTLADSIRQSLNPLFKGFYYEFRNDLSVVSRMPDGNYYWSPKISGAPEVGHQVLGYDYNAALPEVEDIDETFECPHGGCYECFNSTR